MNDHRRNFKVRSITETLTELIPGAAPAHLRVTVAEVSSLDGTTRNTWQGTAYDLAERIAQRLYGRPTPSSGNRLQDSYADLNSRPWYPARPGDILHVHYEAIPQMRAGGETYLVERTTSPDLFALRLIANTFDDDMAGFFAVGESMYPLDTAWFEAGPARLTVVRDGRVLHAGGGA